MTKSGIELTLVAPCTGNTLAKIAHGITDTPVTMAVKATLRTDKPVVLSVSSNDALGANAKNIGTLLNTKIYTSCRSGKTLPTKTTLAYCGHFSRSSHRAKRLARRANSTDNTLKYPKKSI